MSDDECDVGLECDRNDYDGDSDGSCGDDGGTMTLLNISKIEYPLLK